MPSAATTSVLSDLPLRSAGCPGHDAERRPAREPRRPEDTILYRVVRDNLDTFLEQVRRQYEKPLPRYVLQEFERFLDCGVFARGFSRWHCDRCGHDLILPFSCKTRGLCPSCGARRMAETASHLVDRVLPNVPLRQWVLSLPFELRLLAAQRADVVRAFSRMFVETIFASQVHRSGRPGAKCGGVSFVARAGGSINLNIHLHDLILDGVYEREGDQAVFRRVVAPRPEDLSWVVRRFGERALRWLRRNGLLDERCREERSNEAADATALDACAQLALRIGPLETVSPRGRATPGEDDAAAFAPRPGGRWSAEWEGFRVHAGVRIAAGDDEGREQLCRYASRPAIALGRMTLLDDGRIAYRVRHPFGPHGLHRVMTPLEFLARLAAIVPPPRYPLQSYYGVLAPASKWRAAVVPRPPSEAAFAARACPQDPRDAVADASLLSRDPASEPLVRSPDSPARPLISTGVSLLVPSPGDDPEMPPNVITVRHWRRLLDGLLFARSPHLDWATLLRRSLGIDALACPRCHGRLRALDVVTDAGEARRILTAAGLPAEPPPRARARDPTDE